MDIRHPVAAEVDELTSQISEAFGYHKDEEGVRRDFPQLYNAKNFSNLWVAVDGKTVVAHAGYYPAVMKVEALPLEVAGIGGVYTDEKYRGKGLATNLINKCCEEAHKKGAALAFLWSDKNDFYTKLGFHPLARQWFLVLDPTHAPKLRALGEKAEIPARALRITDEPVNGEFLRQSHELQKLYPVGIVRTPEEHAMYLESGACRVISAWVGPQLAAYFVIGKGRDLQGHIHEWGGAEGALHHLAAQCLEDFGHPLTLLSPQYMLDEVPWVYGLEEAEVPANPGYLGLVKLLDFEKVKRLVHDFMRRVGLKPEELVMEKVGDDYSVAWRGKTSMKLTEGEFLRLLFGPEMPQDPELKAFLPLRLWYWGMDSV